MNELYCECMTSSVPLLIKHTAALHGQNDPNIHTLSKLETKTLPTHASVSIYHS